MARMGREEYRKYKLIKEVPLYEEGKLAVSDTFATGAVARSFQTCSLRFRCDKSCYKEMENLQSRISFATDAVARGKLAYSDSDATGAVSLSPRVFATASVANEIRDCKFSISLQQLLSHLNRNLQVWNDLVTAPVANVSETASPSPSPSLAAPSCCK